MWQSGFHFTEDARLVLTLAQHEAARLGETLVGTEHVLLALVRDGQYKGTSVLVGLGIEPDRVRSALEVIIERRGHGIVRQSGLTPGAMAVIELALDEARRLGHPAVGSEHLLLGLIREGNGIAAGLLTSLAVDVDGIRTMVARMHSEQHELEPLAEGPTTSEQRFKMGREEERLSTLHEMTLKILSVRLGAPPEDVRRRIEQLDLEQAERMLEAAATAPSLDVVRSYLP